MKKIWIWTHWDLDGLVSLLTLMWAFPDAEINYTVVDPASFREKWLGWRTVHSPADYDRVFIVDLDISKDADVLDSNKITVIDHHTGHVETADYKTAEFEVVLESSACKLVKRFLEDNYDAEFTEAQQMLIALGDDYDSYTLAVEESSILNALFWHDQNRFPNFIARFKDGFTGFTPAELATYQQLQTEKQAIIDGLEIFKNDKIDIGGHICSIYATTASKFKNEIADYIRDEYQPDVILVIDPIGKRVSFRRGDESLVNLGELAQKIGAGGGHSFAAGGVITEELMELMKILKPVNRKLK